jgi:hypothetical protein
MNEYQDTHSSLLKFAKNFATELQTFGLDFTAENLDAFAEPKMWPDGNLLGIKEFTFAIDDQFIQISAMLIISTTQDKNHFNLAKALNLGLNHLLPGMRMDVLDSNSGAKRGWMIVQNGTEVAPPIESDTRSMQPIIFSLLSDRTL